MSQKYVYFFGRNEKENWTEGKRELKQTLGGKGANLAEMTNLGLPVPPGFTISAEAQDHWVEGKEEAKKIEKEVDEHLAKLEKLTGEKLGDMLFVSVRSGAAISMPGMMDTVLNLGITDDIMPKMVERFGKAQEKFCWDSYRRFIQMFGDIAMGVELKFFEEVLHKMKIKHKAATDQDLTVGALQEIIEEYKKVFKAHTNIDFPQDARKQLHLAISAVFGSWHNERAVAFRRINKIHGLIGTAVNIQTMVYGNMNSDSGTGVAFTRDPANGEKVLFGEFLVNAQGEDVVAGIRTPIKISEMAKKFPKSFDYINECCGILEKHYKHVQDMEFTIQDRKFYFLQTRNGKMTMFAKCKCITDMVKEGLITKKEGIMQIVPENINHFLHPTFDPEVLKTHKSLGTGIAASPGAAVGAICFNNEQAVEFKKEGVPTILVRINTSPEDLIGMHAAQGILTSTGGRTSHAAVVARGMGKCCVCGFGGADVDEELETVKIKDKVFKKGDLISLDGTEGCVYAGPIPTIDPVLPETFKEILSWEKEFRQMEVWTNADTPNDALKAFEFGAQGIGLTRTEHMFFDKERINYMRQMILAERGQKEGPLRKLKPYQVEDFVGIFRVMKGLPVTIRLLDPPLHEFLPKPDKVEEIAEIAKELGVTVAEIKKKIREMHEENPMLGHRGCRLGITFPAITTMQAEAIYEAAFAVVKEGIPVHVDIMIPLINSVEEFNHQRKIVSDVYDRVAAQFPDQKVVKTIGTMIEVPRAAILADKVAKEADFFSFGTNDLTQMTLGFSRDDSKFFVDEYCKLGIMNDSPFEVLDQEGVGWLINHCVSSGRRVKPDLKVGICGEHGGEPRSVKFCYKSGLNYVSCSPFRILIARISACQASIENPRN